MAGAVLDGISPEMWSYESAWGDFPMEAATTICGIVKEQKICAECAEVELEELVGIIVTKER